MSESYHQTQASNIPNSDQDEDMLKRIEVEELHPLLTEKEKNEP